MTSFSPSQEVEFPYEEPLSVWSLVIKTIPKSEQDFIRGKLGVSLIEQADELHDEISVLLEIWETVSENNAKFQQALDQSAIKDRLIREVSLLLEVLQDKAKDENKNIEEVLRNHDKNVVDFCSSSCLSSNSNSAHTSRPTTARKSARNQSGRETPVVLAQTAKANELISYNSNVEDQIHRVKSDMNYLNIDRIIDVLQNMLRHEIHQLKEDIEFLQNCIEDPTREPSLSQIRDERNRLEQDILFRETLPSPTSRKSQLEPLAAGSIPACSGDVKAEKMPLPGIGAPSKLKPLLPQRMNSEDSGFSSVSAASSKSSLKSLEMSKVSVPKIQTNSTRSTKPEKLRDIVKSCRKAGVS